MMRHEDEPDGGCFGPLTRSARILFVGEDVSLAHVGRPAILARWAREAGCEVHLACGGQYAGLAQDEGLEPIPLATVSQELFYSRLRAGAFFYTREELESYVAAERALLRRLKPDLVVGDFRLTLSISCRLEGVPLLMLNHAHWSPAAACPFPPPQAHIFRYLPAAAGAALFQILRPVAFRVFAKVLDQVRVAHGLGALNDFRRLYTDGDWCAYLDLPELMPLDVTPRNHFYLGPLVWQPRAAVADGTEFLSCRGARPLAYVSFGSTGDTAVLPQVLKGVASAGCAAVVAGLPREASNRLLAAEPELKEFCSFAARVNPTAVLQAAALTVCHGGAGTVYQSLAAGVPVLGIPGNPDQTLIANAVANQGAGAVCLPRHARQGRVRELVQQLLENPEPANRARGLSLALQSHDTQGRWLLFLKRHLPKTCGFEPVRAAVAQGTPQ